MSECKLQKISEPVEIIELGPARILSQLKEDSNCPLGYGIVEFRECSVPFKLSYSEILYCLEGELTVRNEKDETETLVSGESIYMSADQEVIYEAAGTARLIYITHGNR